MAEAPVRVLVVDDETPQMKALTETLRAEGFDTTGFDRPAAALEELKRSSFDLILTDLMMPEIDGVALLRAALVGDTPPVGIVMTGAGTIAAAVEAMKAGAFDFILKPFRISVLLPVISRALAMRRLQREKVELEQQVREHSAQLEAANRELEAFSFSVSHDLRAPLRHVMGFCEILQTDHAAELSADGKEIVDTISASATRMSRLIEDLLQFSRLGRQALNRVAVDLGLLVREVVAEQRGDTEGRNLEFRIGELPPVSGDASLLKQVYVNFISNAVKFTREVPAAVVEIGSRQENGVTTYFVRDNGAGFDMATAGKLFEPFQRLHNRERFDGTGVGLSIVANVIKRHGGVVRVEAAVGQGATFYFTLPG